MQHDADAGGNEEQGEVPEQGVGRAAEILGNTLAQDQPGKEQNHADDRSRHGQAARLDEQFAGKLAAEDKRQGCEHFRLRAGGLQRESARRAELSQALSRRPPSSRDSRAAENSGRLPQVRRGADRNAAAGSALKLPDTFTNSSIARSDRANRLRADRMEPGRDRKTGRKTCG